MIKFKSKKILWILGIIKRRGLTFVAGFVIALLCFVLLNAAMHPVSQSGYCGSKCHEMHTALHTWKLSVHGGSERGLRAECIDCHLPEKDKYFRHIITKAYEGGKDMYKHYMRRIFGGEYEPEHARGRVLDRMKNEKCVYCHSGLLDKPSNETVREAHAESLKPSDEESRIRCVECHEDAGHMR